MVAKLTVITATADVWTHRPDLAIQIAHISQIWNLIELRFAEIFIHLARSDRQAVGAMFIAIQSMPTKLQMLRRLSIDRLCQSDQIIFDRLCSRFGRLSKKRVQVIHGIWGIRDDHPHSVFLTKNFFDLTEGDDDNEYTVKRFQRDERDLITLLVDVQKFGNNLYGIGAP